MYIIFNDILYIQTSDMRCKSLHFVRVQNNINIFTKQCAQKQFFQHASTGDC